MSEGLIALGFIFLWLLGAVLGLGFFEEKYGLGEHGFFIPISFIWPIGFPAYWSYLLGKWIAQR